jgi:hypothetical protein
MKYHYNVVIDVFAVLYSDTREYIRCKIVRPWCIIRPKRPLRAQHVHAAIITVATPYYVT